MDSTMFVLHDIQMLLDSTNCAEISRCWGVETLVATRNLHVATSVASREHQVTTRNHGMPSRNRGCDTGCDSQPSLINTNSISRNCDCESGYDSQPKAAQPETAQLRVLLRLATTLNGLTYLWAYD